MGGPFHYTYLSVHQIPIAAYPNAKSYLVVQSENPVYELDDVL